jgi:hypothetical protein
VAGVLDRAITPPLSPSSTAPESQNGVRHRNYSSDAADQAWNCRTKISNLKIHPLFDDEKRSFIAFFEGSQIEDRNRQGRLVGPCFTG